VLGRRSLLLLFAQKGSGWDYASLHGVPDRGYLTGAMQPAEILAKVPELRAWPET
jgi:hypothetical protein